MLRWTGRILLSGPLAALVLALPVIAQASSGSPSWAQYFYPARVGYTCHEELQSKGGQVTGNSVLEVTHITTTAKGISMTLSETGTLDDASGAPAPSTSSLKYLLTKTGNLVTQESSVAVSSSAASVMGTTVIPPVAKLIARKSGISTFTEIVPLTASERKSLTGVLLPNQKDLRINASVRETGLGLHSVTVPMGTFLDSLEVKTTLASVHVFNIQPEAAQGFESQLLPTYRSTLNVTTWYAPGVGPVKVQFKGLSGAFTGCSG
jgi:hypothetical protein